MSAPEPEWTALGITIPAYGGGDSWGQIWPQRSFRGHYLIVTTPGWFIHELKSGNVTYLADVDGDAYSRDEHDRLERLGQLERHRLNLPAEIGNLILFKVSPRCSIAECGEREAVVGALAGHGCTHPRPPFRATIIGTQ